MSKKKLDKNNFNYKVCILAAGKGSRLSDLTKNFNKALLPINFKASISHIIEKFSKEIEIVIAVGHEKSKVTQYLSCAHSDRKITIIEIDKISGLGSGPGYSLFCCKDHLNCPFIFYSVDTIIYDDVPKPINNWMGIAPVEKSHNFCTVSLNGDLITDLYDKIPNKNSNAFIGLAGVRDYEIFFDSLENNELLINGEKQVSNGFKSLINKNLKGLFFSWNDVGNIEGYKETQKKFNRSDEIFNFEKKDEYLYFVENKVIKYFQDKNIVKKRFLRSKILVDLCPNIIKKTENFYTYEKVKGNILYKEKDPFIVDKLLTWLNENLWKIKRLNKSEIDKFKEDCKKFYYNKTKKRLETYFNQYQIKDTTKIINGVEVENVDSLLSSINWNWISDGIPSKFHGDLQFENILHTDKNNFTLIDWRQDFSENVEYGDIYYDLAKLNGGINVSYHKIKQNLFSFKEDSNEIIISTDLDSFLIKSKNIFNQFVERKKFDKIKINILTGIIFLNMAPMHHEPFNHFIYNLGKYTINKWIKLK